MSQYGVQVIRGPDERENIALEMLCIGQKCLGTAVNTNDLPVKSSKQNFTAISPFDISYHGKLQGLLFV
ncbi:predicted protein [Plenodomus lingam JN3]|uniref:Predicted protein n=1 Tax=Leptosphaeria maculans (strain JN3 / isolate v23.1.3 / race Av1-4-5-6-7-8) TaxID=985895 RepID=E5A404_LEPMJ|nr:predicted protein [Plenodomus lingam JN3]CBX98349.1 predicted protein [Plenodomus lingam JN3]